MDQSHDDILSLAVQIVSAHIGHNDTPTDALPDLIRNVYKTLATVEPSEFVAAPAPAPRSANTRPSPVPSPVPSTGRSPAARQTVFSDRLTCMECGLTMKMLKRHLITVHDLSPDQYREKWNLPSSYALVASDYAKLRSSLAKQSGLGKRPESKTGRRR